MEADPTETRIFEPYPVHTHPCTMDKIIDMVGGENRGKEGKKAVGDAAIRLDWRPSKNVLHFSVVGLPS